MISRKVLAYGLCAYLSDGWNVLDFSIVIVCVASSPLVVSAIPQLSHLSTLKTLRALRPLRTTPHHACRVGDVHS